MAHRAGLLGCFFRTGNDVLLFHGLNPESWRKISEVRNDGDEGAPRVNPVPALANLPVEMRNYGDEQIRRLFAPEFLEQVHKWLMEKSNSGLKDAKKLCTAERPAILQHDVVLLLDANAGQLAQYVQPVGKILKLNQFDLPVALLLRNHC